MPNASLPTGSSEALVEPSNELRGRPEASSEVVNFEDDASAPTDLEIDLVLARQNALRRVVIEGMAQCGEQSRGLAVRFLSATGALKHVIKVEPALDFDLAAVTAACQYGGAPATALAGYALGDLARRASLLPGQREETAEVVEAVAGFLAAVERQQGRTTEALKAVATDEVTLLGIADGLLAGSMLAPTLRARCSALVPWVLERVDTPVASSWSERARALAGDLLDNRGRLRARLDHLSVDSVALDVALRSTWPSAFAGTPHIDRVEWQRVAAAVLRDAPPPSGAVERGAARLAAFELFLAQTAAGLVPNIDEVARILSATQGALKRWVWDANSRRKGTDAARWLIDDESHVQALLWTILYPRFGEALVDEEYLPGFGLKQPRSDFGITSLKLIVEVKIVRTPSDFVKIEEEVAGDLGLYFSAPERYDRMLVYVYDDCDSRHPERHHALSHALKKRDKRVTDVIVVLRPGMIPDRSRRGTAG